MSHGSVEEHLHMYVLKHVIQRNVPATSICLQGVVMAPYLQDFVDEKMAKNVVVNGVGPYTFQ